MLKNADMTVVDFCAVLPVCNERETIVAVVSEVLSVLAKVASIRNVLVIVVDDCSTDDGITLLKDQWSQEKARLEVVRLDTPHGLNMALLQGFKKAATYSPRLTLTMDADGQDDPVFIPDMIKLSSDCDIVFAARGKRSESMFFKLCYVSLQLLIKALSDKTSGVNHFCLVKPQVVSWVASLSYVDYFGAMLDASSFKRKSFVVPRRARIAGESKFSLRNRTDIAFAIICYHPRLLTRLFYGNFLLLTVIAIIAIFTSSIAVAVIFFLLALFSQLLGFKLLTTLALRATLPAAKTEEN